jgi:hypothetical protein
MYVLEIVVPELLIKLHVQPLQQINVNLILQILLVHLIWIVLLLPKLIVILVHVLGVLIMEEVV